MATKWIPVSGDFLCPGNILLTADDKGIVIKRGSRALATTEWPGENIRVCELVENPDTPKPDWSQAPRHATWWVVDPTNVGFWAAIEPTLFISERHSCWTVPDTTYLYGQFSCNIPLGVDWRLLKERRPE